MLTKINYTFLIIMLSFLPTILFCQGWTIVEEDGSVTVISGDWIKMADQEEGSFTSIFNLSTGSLILVNRENRYYAEGSMEEYCNAIKSMTSSMMEGMPPEQREMMEAYMTESAGSPAREVVIEKSGEGEKVAGYSTEKYEVVVDGELYEELWITYDASLDELIKTFARVEPVTTEMVLCTAFETNIKNDPEYSETYLELMRTGMAMKSIRYEYGSAQAGTNILRIERKAISPDEFRPPEGFEKIDFQQFMGSLEEME